MLLIVSKYTQRCLKSKALVYADFIAGGDCGRKTLIS